MAIIIRKNTQIKGIMIANKSTVISQYADDTTLFLSDQASLQAAIKTLNQFTIWSGLRINLHKSHLLLLGNHLDPPTFVDDIRVVQKVKILGIWFKNNMSEAENFNLNFEPNINRIKTICGAWSNRNLSVKGKITLISSLMISLLQFPCTSIPTPSRVFTDFRKIVLDFVWNGKGCKIAYNVMVQEIGRGGLKMPDLWTRVQVIHLNWVKYMWRNQDSLLSSIFTHTVSYPNVQSLLLCKTNFINKVDKRYHMLSQILGTWSELHYFNPSNEQEIQGESLWFNCDITIGKEQICWRSWLNAGITRVNDLLHQDLPRFLSHDE